MFDLVSNMIESAKDNEFYEKFSSPDRQLQLEIIRKCEVSSLWFRGFIDFVEIDSDGIFKNLCDVKTVNNMGEFYKNVYYKFEYWYDAAMYSLLTGADKFTYFVVEKTFPYICVRYTFNQFQLTQLIGKLYNEILIPLRNCLETGFYSDEVQLEIPKYFIKNNNYNY